MKQAEDLARWRAFVERSVSGVMVLEVIGKVKGVVKYCVCSATCSIVAVPLSSKALSNIACAAAVASRDSSERCWHIDFCFALLRTNPERVTHNNLSIKLMLFMFGRRSGADLAVIKSSKLYYHFQTFVLSALTGRRYLVQLKVMRFCVSRHDSGTDVCVCVYMCVWWVWVWVDVVW
jgi:hypothetical protein